MTQTFKEPRCDGVVILAASTGLGGGIETMLESTVGVLRESGFPTHVVALSDGRHPAATLRNKLVFMWRASRTAWRHHSEGLEIIVAHPSLIVVGLLAARLGRSRRTPVVIFYLVDLWNVPRRHLRLLRRGAVRSLTISDYAAGALAMAGATPGWVLPATLDAKRTAALSRQRRRRDRDDLIAPCVLTVLRLEVAEEKGVFVLIEAVERCRAKLPGATVTIAGGGPVPETLSRLARQHEWVRVVVDLSIDDLAELYGQATLFALCTRTRPWGRPIASGEGLGLVLAEAQLTGLPVVAPATGGSSNAYLEGLTGVRPTDETVEALAAVLLDVLSQPERYEKMSAQALAWAPEAFDQGRLRHSWEVALRADQGR